MANELIGFWLNQTSVKLHVTFLPRVTHNSLWLTATPRQTSLQNKHLHNCDNYKGIPSCSHCTIFATFATTELRGTIRGSKYSEFKIYCWILALSSKLQMWSFHVVVIRVTPHNYSKVGATRVARLFSSFDQWNYCFMALPLSSSMLKFPYMEFRQRRRQRERQLQKRKI